MNTFGKLGTVCMIGTVNNNTFVNDKDKVIGTITRTSMNNLPNDTQRYTKLVSKVKQNLQALSKQIQHIALLPEDLRVFRISSNLLPLFDEPTYGKLYDAALLSIVGAGLARIKTIIDTYGVRVGFHPDAFCIINSDNPDVRAKSVLNLQYHHYVLSQLQSWEDGANINIHFSGKLDYLPDDVLEGIADLKPYLSLENDDTLPSAKDCPRAGFDQTLQTCEKYGIRMLLDVHHYYCEKRGVHFDFNQHQNDFKRVLNTWQPNVRPLFHVSQSASTEVLEPRKLSAHSDMITCDKVVDITRELLSYGDVELEAKFKNVAVKDLYNKLSK